MPGRRSIARRRDKGYVLIGWQAEARTMGAKPERRYVTVEEYLAGEEIGDVRHEYVAGEVYAMVGTTARHNLIAGNLFVALRNHLRGTGCRLFMSDVKVRLQMLGQTVFYYPDLMLTCEPPPLSGVYCDRPCLLVEVLSESSARTDRREKLFAYTQIPSLREYLILFQDRMEAELYRREEGWRLERITTGEIRFECVDAAVPLAAVYEDAQVE